jgi:hypothetical protein
MTAISPAAQKWVAALRQNPNLSAAAKSTRIFRRVMRLPSCPLQEFYQNAYREIEAERKLTP